MRPAPQVRAEFEGSPEIEIEGMGRDGDRDTGVPGIYGTAGAEDPRIPEKPPRPRARFVQARVGFPAAPQNGRRALEFR